MTPDLLSRLARVRLLAMDVDGVLTDGGMYYGSGGVELKKFNTRDGMGIGLLHAAGLRTAFISGERLSVIRARARKLKVGDCLVGVAEKGEALERVAVRRGVPLDAVAYVGDDVNDLPALAVAGLAIAVADAMEPVRRVAHLVTTRKGGEGAVREVADLILAARAEQVAV